LIDQRRPVGNDLLDLRSSGRKAGDGRRTVEHHWNELTRESLDGRFVVAPHADANLHFGGIARVSDEWAMCRVRTDKLGQDVIELQPEVDEPLTEHAVGELSFL